MIIGNTSRLADTCINETGAKIPASTLTVESRGVLCRAWAIAKGEPLKEDEERVEKEEINIAPVFIIVVAAAMIFRYIGLGMGEKDNYVMGGMRAAIFLRYSSINQMSRRNDSTYTHYFCNKR